MYYKASNTIGVRRKQGEKDQAFSFGGKRCRLSEEVLREYADQALEELDSGISEDDVALIIFTTSTANRSFVLPSTSGGTEQDKLQ